MFHCLSLADPTTYGLLKRLFSLPRPLSCDPGSISGRNSGQHLSSAREPPVFLEHPIPHFNEAATTHKRRASAIVWPFVPLLSG